MTTRVLWVSAEVPDRNGGGGQRRQYHLLKALLRAGIDVTVAVPRTDQDPSSVEGLTATEVVESSARRWAPGLATPFDRLVSDGSYDTVVVVHTGSLRLVPRTLRARAPRVIVDVQNVDSRWERSIGDEQAARRIERVERSALSRGPALACSVAERTALLALDPSAEVTIVRQGFDPSEWPDWRPTDAPGATFGFFGSLWYPINLDGVRWFLSSVWPHVRDARPDAVLELYGPGRPEGINDPDRGVFVKGWAEDLASAVRTTDVLVVPILKGPGSRVKFPEALASGVPVVATSVGAESFDADGCFECADTPEDFADASLRVLDDPEAARSMAARARAHAMESLTWDHAAAALVDLLDPAGPPSHH